MSSGFEKKLARFLESAKEHDVIGQREMHGLMSYLREGEFENKGWFNLSYAMGMLGALAISFGLLLIIATNWHMFSDLTKITGYSVMLASFHLSALFLTNKGYERTAQSLHFCGAAFVIAGIGLMSQMFHLHSHQGTAFLTWAIMILPLAIILQSGAILLLSIVAFVCWGNIYIDYVSIGYRQFLNMTFFNMAVCFTITMVGLLMKKLKFQGYAFLQTPGMIGIVFILYFLGFIHNFKPKTFEVINLFLPYAVLIPSIFILVYMTIIGYITKASRYFIYIMWSVLAAIVAFALIFSLSGNSELYFERFAFGRTQKVYIFSLFASIIAWVSYFALAFWGVAYGALNHQRWMLNCNVILIGIGAFTRFIDLVGSMMDTGIAFIICGIFLFVIGFALEKWRRNLIASETTKGEGYEY